MGSESLEGLSDATEFYAKPQSYSTFEDDVPASQVDICMQSNVQNMNVFEVVKIVSPKHLW